MEEWVKLSKNFIWAEGGQIEWKSCIYIYSRNMCREDLGQLDTCGKIVNIFHNDVNILLGCTVELGHLQFTFSREKVAPT